MLLAPSFKDELRRLDLQLARLRLEELRKDLTAAQQADLAWCPGHLAPPMKAESIIPDLRAHVARWIKDHRAQEVWASIKGVASNLEAEPFIATVVYLRGWAVSSVTDVVHYKKCQEHITYLYKTLPKRLPQPSAEILEALAEFLRLPAPPENPKVGDQGSEASRALNLFVRTLGKLFHELCGQPRDYETGVLAEIAFDAKDLDAKKIRDIRTGQRGRRKPVT
jgi:hypothetical protein